MATRPNSLAARLAAASAQTLHYSRKRFLWTWLALGLLALAIAILFLVWNEQANTDEDQTRDIAELSQEKAESAQKDTDAIGAYLRGDQGLPGVPGADGEDGTPGLPGTGEMGAPGGRGPAGPVGPAGPAGPPGPQGPPGAVTSAAATPGLPGPAGPKGDTGPQGNAGETGARGAAGENGQDGAAGANGADGAVGPQGPAGPPTTFQTAFATTASNTATPKNQNATCPAGTRIVGGGFSVDPPDGVRVTVSLPFGSTVWNVQAQNVTAPGAWSLTAWAVCTV